MSSTTYEPVNGNDAIARAVSDARRFNLRELAPATLDEPTGKLPSSRATLVCTSHARHAAVCLAGKL